ncbi:hypothetical protein HYPSUDRAFT_666524 [Hypholoma sublateritium FD-334 SS-4]|uniref:Uncharacterized protein n=1 Tax=Hypholoma sublateritium (strain FD-334 SS-4) TaxID=945553 RepID=A0A0D2P0B2_HYPSF|nr:hypothetical protein HYPSUDRAFT_666524 [Hypholoma sublateritium FD-334 SS-4]
MQRHPVVLCYPQLQFSLHDEASWDSATQAQPKSRLLQTRSQCSDQSACGSPTNMSSDIRHMCITIDPAGTFLRPLSRNAPTAFLLLPRPSTLCKPPSPCFHGLARATSNGSAADACCSIYGHRNAQPNGSVRRSLYAFVIIPCTIVYPTRTHT